MNTLQEITTSRDVVATLNRQQANALTLYLNYKKYHWLTYGPLFRDIHLLFDEHATQVLAMIDEFAERALMIDGMPIADPAAYLPASTVKASAGNLSLRQMVAEAIENLETVIRELHADTATATAIDDIGTADVYTRLVQDFQKQRWFLKEILRKSDGLVN
jgi:starvation-inducible DNA-binding protein